jgi:hypothetical protein
MDNQQLSDERNLFIAGLVIVVLISWLIRGAVAVSAASGEQEQNFAAGATLVGKACMIYFVYRLSTFLKNPSWVTLVYCVLTPFALLYLWPISALLWGVRKARKNIVATCQVPAR